MNYQKKCLHITVFSVMEQNEYSFFFKFTRAEMCFITFMVEQRCSFSWWSKVKVLFGVCLTFQFTRAEMCVFCQSARA